MILESRLLKGMVAAAPKNEPRYYLSGVHIAKGVIEATNGHYLFRAKVDTGDEERLFSLTGNIPVKAQTTELDFASSLAAHKDRHGRVVGASYIEEIDGKFPDCERIVKEFKPEEVLHVGFKPEYLGLPYVLFKAGGAKLEFGGENTASKVTFNTSDLDEVEMYIMPMKL